MHGVVELLNPPPPAIQETDEQRYWLILADIALQLDEAREEQEQIKRAMRPAIEKYKRLIRRRKSR